MKWVCIGLLVLLFVFLLCLLLPVRYYFTFEKWKFFLHVDVLFGLWKKEIHVPTVKEDSAGGPPSETQGGQEEPADAEEMVAALEKAERSAAHEVPSGGEQKPDDKPETGSEQKAGKELSTDEDAAISTDDAPVASGQQPEATTGSLQSTDDSTPSLFAQIRFAIGNGLAGRVFHGAWKLLLHSFPGHWEVTGTFGTGDPMDTAMVQGLFCAFLPGVADGVAWNYIEQADTLQGKGRGRIIPLYVAYVALTVLLSKEMREFWQYRKAVKS